MSSSIARTAPARMSVLARLRDGLVFAGRVDQVSAAVDADPRAPHEHRVADGRAPFGAVGDVRGGLAFVDDQRQVLAGEGHAGRRGGPWRQSTTSTRPSGVADERALAVAHRRVGVPVEGERRRASRSA